jgi:hypothetical protein
MERLSSLLSAIAHTLWDVTPIALILFGFQWLVIRRPMPNLKKVLTGFAYTVIGLTLFLQGLEEALFPLGKLMARQLADPTFVHGTGHAAQIMHWWDYRWVYLFAAAIGFSCAIAEPVLIAVATQAHHASGGVVSVWGLRIAVAIGTAAGVTLGTLRIVTDIPLYYYVIVGYVIVMIQTLHTPRMIVALAYDTGPAVVSTITIPLVVALGLGLASAIPGRSPLLDGFGLIALTVLCPLITVMGYAQLSEWLTGRRKTKTQRKE